MAFPDLRSIAFPYCLQQQPDGAWVLLNREYKPLGFRTHDFIRYDDYPVAIALERALSPALRRQLSWTPDHEGQCLYLYNDAGVPVWNEAAMASYLEKLRILMHLRVA